MQKQPSCKNSVAYRVREKKVVKSEVAAKKWPQTFYGL